MKYLNKKLVLKFLITIWFISCSSVNKASIEKKSNFDIKIFNRKHDSYQQVINDFYTYDYALRELDKNNYIPALDFLAIQKNPNSMNEVLRLELLKNLGNNGNSSLFLNEFDKLPQDVINEEIECYDYLFDFNNKKKQAINKISQLSLTNENFSDGCIKLYGYAAQQGFISTDDVWHRIWILLSYNQVNNARYLSNLINDPLPDRLGSFKRGTLGEQAGLMYLVISPKNRNNPMVNRTLNNIASKLNVNQLFFVHGILGISKAKDLNFTEALFHYQNTDERYLSNDQWEWLARSLLRTNNWHQLNIVIDAMPEKLSNTPTWKYWKARSIENINTTKKDFVIDLYEQVAKSGRNFYAILANEHLGRNLNVSNNVVKVKVEDILKIKKDAPINRALILFKESKHLDNIKMRIAAQNQWKYAVRNYDEDMLIVAGQLALENNFYEMAIYSAEKTNCKLNFNLRYLYPYKQIITKYSNAYGIDRAWAFGIIRQESRFMNIAVSRSGALGLMQLMPGTTKFIANKLGLKDYNVYNIDTNIQMGIWYLAYIFENLGSYVLATAGYNAGQVNARKWQDNKYLDASVYIETIPFNETRNYVKKVMTNSVYYANLFKDKKKFLRDFLSAIPPNNESLY